MPTRAARSGQLHTGLIYELTKAVAAATSLDAIFDAALDCLNASLGTDRSAILLFDDQQKMRFRAWRNLSEEYRRAVDGHSPWDPETQDPEPVLVSDVTQDASLRDLCVTIQGEGINSLAFFPLAAESKLLGKFMVYYEQPHEFTDVEIMAAQTIAAQVGFALHQHDTRERNTQLDAVNRAVVDAFGVAVYTTDAEGYITRYNEAAAQLWGRRPQIGKDQWCGSWRIFQPDGTPMELDDCPMGIALKQDRVVRNQEIMVENPDGSRHTVLPYPTPIHNDAGQLIGAINVLVDITDQSRMRSELKAALQAKDDFLGQVSHELRTPLTQLMGNAHLLVKRWDMLDEASKSESLTEIMLQSQRMKRLVNNMLFLSRLERGMLPRVEPHLVQRLIEPTLAEFRRRYPQTSLVTSIDTKLPPVETHPSTIDQVLWNLLTNAQKYGPATGPVEVSTNRAGDWIEVTVLDTGPGVPEEASDQLFEPYFRASQTADQAAGLGLGLSVCKKLIESHGGRIWAKRRAPEGMEFGFALPAVSG